MSKDVRILKHRKRLKDENSARDVKEERNQEKQSEKRR